MNNHHLQLADTAGPRVDGIDMAQLLSNLGEASAACSAVDLFGLCLSAQRVLASVCADGAGTAPDEALVLAAFRGSADDARRDMLIMMLAIAEGSPRRPTRSLTLVQSHQTTLGGMR